MFSVGPWTLNFKGSGGLQKKGFTANEPNLLVVCEWIGEELKKSTSPDVRTLSSANRSDAKDCAAYQVAIPTSSANRRQKKYHKALHTTVSCATPPIGPYAVFLHTGQPYTPF
jgi:hypothetical protein